MTYRRQVLCNAKFSSFVALLCVQFLAASRLSAQTLTLELLGDFEEGWDALWTERVLATKRTTYEVVERNGDLVLQAMSMASASGLWRTVGFDNVLEAKITWRWTVERSIPNNSRELEKSGDDYAARLFVVFGSDPFSRSARAICYAWASSQPVGSVFRSPYADNVVMMVLESGDARAGTWVREERNVVADYRQAFGEAPVILGAVAVMVDTDDTGSLATAWFDDVALELTGER